MFFQRRKTKSDLPAGVEFSSAARVVMTPSAPPDERRDAETLTLKKAAEAAQQINPTELLHAVQQMERLFAKAGQPIDLPEDRPQEQTRPRKKPGIARINLDLDDEGPNQFSLHRPVGLDFPALRAVVQGDVTLQAIQWTRIWQVQRFLKPSKQEWRPGFRIQYTSNDDISEQAKAKLQWLTNYILHCGAQFDPRKRKRLKRDRLRDYVAKKLQDSMTYDAAGTEIVSTLSGRPHGFVHVDGSKLFLTDPNYGLEPGWGNPELHERFNLHIPDPEEVIAVLSWDSRILAHYTDDDLIYSVRKPSPLMESLGYGQPEPEQLINIVTGFLNALTMNIRGLSHNSIPKGILTLFGDFQDEDLQQFKSSWDSYVSGITNLWRMPVMVAKDKESGAIWTKTDVEFNEMYFSKWMTFLMAIKCALYGMDPEEVNFEAFTSNKSTLSGNDTEERLASSKDKGLYPTLEFLGSDFDDIVKMHDPNAEFIWTGLDPDQKAAQDAEQKMLTYGEFRQRRGEEPHPMEVLNDAPMDAGLMSLYQQELQSKRAEEQQKQQMQMMQQQQGDPDDDEDDETDGDGNRVMPDHEGNMWQVKNKNKTSQDDPPKGFLAKATRAEMMTQEDSEWP